MAGGFCVERLQEREVMSRCDEWNDEKIDLAIILLLRSMGALSGYEHDTESLVSDINEFLKEA